MKPQLPRPAQCWPTPASVGPRILGPLRLCLLVLAAWLGGGETLRAADYSNWMTVHWDKIKTKTLRQLVIPGTHDSGSYDMVDAWEFTDADFWSIAPKFDAPDTAAAASKYVASGPFFKHWAKTQSRTIYEQLKDGIRALDLRVAYGPNGDFWIVHSLYGPRLKVVLNDIARFVREQPGELLYVRFDHFHDLQLRTATQYNGGTDRMQDARHRELRAQIQAALGDHLILNWTPEKTLEALRDPANQRRIALFYNEQENVVADSSGNPIGPLQRISGFVSDARFANNSDWVSPDLHQGDPTRFKTLTLQRIESAQTNPMRMHRLGAVTPTDQQFDAWWQDGGIGGNNPKSLEGYAGDTNPHLAKWIRDEWSTKQLNVIHMDFYPDYLVPLCLQLNGIAVPAFTIPDDTDWGNYRTLRQILSDAYQAAANWTTTAAADVESWFNTAYSDVNAFFATVGSGIQNFFEQRFEAPQAGTPPPGGVAAGVRHYQVTVHRITVLNAVGESDRALELYGQIYMVPSPFASTDKGANKTLWALSEGSAQRVPEQSSLIINATKNLYVPENQASGLQVAVGGVIIDNDDSIFGGGGDDRLDQDTGLRPGPLVFHLGNLGENEGYPEQSVEYVMGGEGRVAVYFSARRLAAPLIQTEPPLEWTVNFLTTVGVDRLNRMGTGLLQAFSGIPGRIEYQPAAGTFLPPGTTLDVRAKFIPNDTRRYTEKVISRSVVVGPLRRPIPGPVEAEDFDAFHDLSTGPSTESTTDSGGGLQVTATQAGEWLAYHVLATAPFHYVPSLRFATASAGQRVRLMIDGQPLPGGDVTLPDTGGLQRWQTMTLPGLPLPTGTRRLEVHFLTGGVNLNRIHFAFPAQAEYSQNFDAFADGTTSLGDGSALVSTHLGTATRIHAKELRLTEQTVDGTDAAFQLPGLGVDGLPTWTGFEASFRFWSSWPVPLSFRYGTLSLRFLEDIGTSVRVLVDGQLVPGGEGRGFFTAHGDWHAVVIRWSKQTGTGRLSVTIDGQTRLSEIMTPGFDPSPADGMSIVGSVGSPIRRNLLLDDVRVSKLPPETRILTATVGATDFSLLALGSFTTDYTLRNEGNSPLSIRSLARSDGRSPDADPMILGAGETRALKLFQLYEGDGDYRVTLTINSDATAGVDASGNQFVEFIVTAPVRNSGARLVARFPLDANGDSADGRFVAEGTKDVTFGGPGARSWTGLAARFNGKSSRIRHAWNALLNPGTEEASSSFTVTAWARHEGSEDYQSVVTSRRAAAPDSTGYILYQNPAGNWEFWSGNGLTDGDWQTVSSPSGNPGQWKHLALVYDATFNRKTLYVDGENVGTENTIVGANRQQPFHIGSGDNLGDAFFFNGDIDDVAVFLGALTRSEVRRVMNGQYDALVVPPERLLARMGGNDLGSLTAVDGRIVAKFTLINRGTAPVTVRRFRLPAEVSLDWTGGTLAPQSSREITMVRQTSQSGPAAWQIVVSSDATSGADAAGDLTLPFTAQVTLSTGTTTISAFTGADPGEGLDLDGPFIYAFNVGSSGAAGRARDAQFTADNAPGITLSAGNEVANWSTPEYGPSSDDQVLEKVMQSIRWSSAPDGTPPSVDMSLTGLTAGNSYKLQLLFTEACCDVRAFDVLVAGQVIVREFSPAAVQGGANGTPANGAVITHEFTAASATLAISLDGRNVSTPEFTDHNATLSGVTLEALGANASSSDADLVSLVSSTGFIPAFDGRTTTYSVSVSNTVDSITVTPTASQPNATIQVNGAAVPSGATSAAMSLAVGSNPITITVTAPNGATVKSYVLTVTRAAAVSPPDEGTPGLNRLFYSDRPGLTLDDFYPAPRGKGAFPTGAEPVGASPTQSGRVTSFEAPTDIDDDFGQILHGYIVPKETGDYTFYLCSDDQSELWLSTDNDPTNARLIASEPEWNPPRTWNTTDRRPIVNGRPTNVSPSIRLVAGQSYYVEAMMKEAGGGDHLAVAWTPAGAPAPANGSAPIPGTFLRTKSTQGPVPPSSPRLTLLREGASLIVTWPHTSGFLLERTSRLAADSVWINVPFDVRGTTATTRDDPIDSAVYFRLRLP
ncbi:MAG: cadherin-like beta sandwich domain-containing protein [Verrucomicrobiales bacterium]|nr:cadherin-like beta sandwich domain-containing protein [Verrucomicrobiales bacterium]